MTTAATATPGKKGAAAGRRVLLGLIGAPIKHSATPSMHEAAGDALGLRVLYQLIEVAGADKDKLRRMLDGVRWLGFSGVNVTFPYKEAVVPLLDGFAPGVENLAAVNTVVVSDGKLVGHNTDSSGFGKAVVDVFKKVDGPVALIGSGGVGRAIAFALAELKAPELRILDRDPAKAQGLADDLADRVSARVCGTVEEALKGAVGAVNGTPVGMLPDRNTPIPAELLHDRLWVADAVYSPLWTPLLKAAKERGARVMTGRELAIWQAADAFKLFTGLDPSQDRMGKVFDEVIARRAEQSH